MFFKRFLNYLSHTWYNSSKNGYVMVLTCEFVVSISADELSQLICYGKVEHTCNN